MSEVEKYIEERKKRDLEFAENFEEGYVDFKIGIILRQAREAAGLTQEEVARKLNTQKSAISHLGTLPGRNRTFSVTLMATGWALNSASRFSAHFEGRRIRVRLFILLRLLGLMRIPHRRCGRSFGRDSMAELGCSVA